MMSASGSRSPSGNHRDLLNCSFKTLNCHYRPELVAPLGDAVRPSTATRVTPDSRRRDRADHLRARRRAGGHLSGPRGFTIVVGERAVQGGRRTPASRGVDLILHERIRGETMTSRARAGFGVEICPAGRKDGEDVSLPEDIADDLFLEGGTRCSRISARGLRRGVHQKSGFSPGVMTLAGAGTRSQKRCPAPAVLLSTICCLAGGSMVGRHSRYSPGCNADRERILQPSSKKAPTAGYKTGSASMQMVTDSG